MRPIYLLLAVLIGGFAGWMPAFGAGAESYVPDQAYLPKTVQVSLHKPKILRVGAAIKEFSVGNVTIANAQFLDSRTIQLFGFALGTTNMVFWDKNKKLIESINIEVTPDLDTLKEKLHQLLPGEQIQVHVAQEMIVLNGEVSSLAKMDAALELAQGYVPAKKSGGGVPPGGGSRASASAAKVLNLMQVGGAQQVMLEVQVAEISRSLTKRINMKFNAISPGSPWTIGGVNGGAAFPEAILDNVPQFNPITGEFIEFADGVAVPIFNSVPYGPTIQEFVPGNMSIADKGLFATFLNSDLLFNLVLDAAKEKGLAKVLAEPTLTTLTGQEASFLAGGEFPIPVIGGNDGSVSIVYKEYGVGLKFLPTVLDSGMINLKLNITVSELSNANSVAVGSANVSSAIFVPGLTKRSANSTIVLGSGQTMGIAGLISESLRENVDKLPFLGEVPILGMLFSSQEYIKGQTELVIFVTPHFAQPIQRDQVKLPTDAFVEPSDLEFYLLGRIEGQPPEPEQGQAEQAPIPDLSKGGLEGKFGHDL